MDFLSTGKKNVAIVERWPSVEVRLYVRSVPNGF